MDHFPAEEDSSRFDALIERLAVIKDKYGNQYPIILFEPNIETQEKKTLRDLIHGNNEIHFFSEFEEAFKFAQSLCTSFLLIFSSEYNEKILLEGFQRGLDFTYYRRMLDFEEQALLKELFNDISDPVRNSLKVYVFVTLLELITETQINEDEKEVMVMCDLKEMVNEFRQEFTIIWYDPHITSEIKEKIGKEIDSEIEEKNIYRSFEELCNRIKDSHEPPYHLILSGKNEAEKIFDKLPNLKDLLGLYVYCKDSQIIKIPPDQSDKVDIRETLEKLLPKIKEGIRTRSKLKNTFPAFATNFDAIDKSHIYNVHYYLKGLVKFYNRRQAKEDFLRLARKIYQDQAKALTEFQNKYNQYDKESILRWYTSDSPIYRLINNCLRISSSDSILYSRLILKDIEEAIRKEYQEKNRNFNGIVYRGAYISGDEWAKLQKNVGEEIEMYGFLSTTVNVRVAENFMRADPENKVFITIIIPPLPELDEQGFADVSEFSEFRGEKEILFNVRSRFRILETKISRIGNRGPRCRHLVLLYGAQSLRRYMTQCQPVIQVELELPTEVKCNSCGSNDVLFGFKSQETTQVRCIGYLIKDSIPKNALLVALDSEKGNESIAKSFKGKLLEFNKPVSFPYYGYTCHNCKKTGKEKYYRWITSNKQEMIAECSQCFEQNRKVESELLLFEENPYALWQEHQTEWERVESDYFQSNKSEFNQSEDQGGVYLEVQNFKSCVAYEEKMVNKLKRRRREEMKKGKCFFRLGMAHKDSGNNQKSIECFKKGPYIWKKVFYEEKTLIDGVSYDNLGVLHDNLGEYKKALKYHNKALEIWKGMNDGKHIAAANSYNGLGMLYSHLGEYQLALKYHNKALDLYKTFNGENHPQTASSFANLGFVHKNLGEYQEALKYSKQALELYKAIYGEKHPKTATLYNNLGTIFLELGEYNQGLDFHLKALDIGKAIYGEDHIETANFYGNVAQAYRVLGQYQQALTFSKKALDLKKSVFGEEHIETAHMYNILAMVYDGLEDNQNSLENHKRALNIRKAIYGDKHPDTAISYNNLALVHERLGEYQQALGHLISALDIAKAIYGDGEKHTQTAQFHNNVGMIYLHLKEYQQAREHILKGLDMRKAIFGENHKHTLDSYNNLLLLCWKSEDLQQALEYSKRALNIRKIILGETHTETVILYYQIGVIQLGLQEYQQALEYLLKALDIRKAISGEENVETVNIYCEIITTYRRLGEVKMVREYAEKILKVSKVVYGENIPPMIYQISRLRYSGVGGQLRFFRQSIIQLLVVIIIYLLSKYLSE